MIKKKLSHGMACSIFKNGAAVFAKKWNHLAKSHVTVKRITLLCINHRFYLMFKGTPFIVNLEARLQEK